VKREEQALMAMAMQRVQTKPAYRQLCSRMTELKEQRHRDRLNVQRYPKSIQTCE